MSFVYHEVVVPFVERLGYNLGFDKGELLFVNSVVFDHYAVGVFDIRTFDLFSQLGIFFDQSFIYRCESEIAGYFVTLFVDTSGHIVRKIGYQRALVKRVARYEINCHCFQYEEEEHIVVSLQKAYKIVHSICKNRLQN